MDKLENALYSDPIIESQEYDIYCWAKDSAVDTAGNARPNYQTQASVNAVITDVDSGSGRPGGGATKRVWVVDATPPTMIYVSGEAIAEDTIQLTLQLDEPGTIWCTPVALDTEGVNGEIEEDDFGVGQQCYPSTGGTTLWSDCVKGFAFGAGSTIFKVYVPEAYRNVDLEMNRAANSAFSDSLPLLVETDYKYMCYAEDDWESQAPDTTNGARSPNYAFFGTTPANNPVAFASSTTFMGGIGPN